MGETVRVVEYKVGPRTSTVNGYPGRETDWSKFDWEGKHVHIEKCWHRDCDHKHENTAPQPWVDGKGSSVEYLHVAWNWIDDQTVYRVRPNDSMWPKDECHKVGVYRGLTVKQIKAIKKDDGWYWQLHGEISRPIPNPTHKAKR